MVGIRPDVSARWVREKRAWPDLPENKANNAFLTKLTDTQREVLSTLLAVIGCEIILAENGRQALEAVSVSRPDIVFMDMRMPEIDGLEATRRIVRDYGAGGLKVVATSASIVWFSTKTRFGSSASSSWRMSRRSEAASPCVRARIAVYELGR